MLHTGDGLEGPGGYVKWEEKWPHSQGLECKTKELDLHMYPFYVGVYHFHLSLFP